jgi:hypothetical protein
MEPLEERMGSLKQFSKLQSRFTKLSKLEDFQHQSDWTR